MKNVRIILLLFCMVELLGACKSTTTIPSTQVNEGKPARSISAIGMLLKQGLTTYQYGTHVLNDKDGKTIYALKSESIKLDDYMGKKVELQGIPVEGYPIEGGPEYLEVIKMNVINE